MRGRGSVTGVLALVAIMVAVSLGGWAVLRHGTGCALAFNTPCLRVLFLGNSYTFVNELPEVFAGLVRSGGSPVEVGMVAPGGGYLEDLAKSADVDAALHGSQWTDVVLQEQSMAPASAMELQQHSIPAAASLVSSVRAAGAIPLFLQTWAHRDGWPEMGLDYARMQVQIDAGYDAMGTATQATVIRAGDAWQQALTQAPGLVLWQDDGSHPALAGTYLVACVLYADITGRSPVGLGETAGVDQVIARQLQEIAAQAPGLAP